MKFNLSTAKILANLLNYNGDVNEFLTGINVELEHGTKFPATNITNDDPVMTAKIALAHLNEVPDYYTKLVQYVDKEEHLLNALKKGFKSGN